jgi:type IV pilus assembly protein PilV
MNPKSLTRLHSHQVGFSLLEVLIALLVLSIGLIGTAALSLNALTNVHSALNTSLASTIALDTEERFWLEATQLASPGCPSESFVDDVVLDAAEDDWTRGSPFLSLPDLSITRQAYQSDGRSVRVSVRVTWTESRFGGGNEIFDYTFSALCLRPQPNAN